MKNGARSAGGFGECCFSVTGVVCAAQPRANVSNRAGIGVFGQSVFIAMERRLACADVLESGKNRMTGLGI